MCGILWVEIVNASSLFLPRFQNRYTVVMTCLYTCCNVDILHVPTNTTSTEDSQACMLEVSESLIYHLKIVRQKIQSTNCIRNPYQQNNGNTNVLKQKHWP